MSGEDQTHFIYQALADLQAKVDARDELIRHFWLYTGEFEVKKMSTPERELFADIIDAWSSDCDGECCVDREKFDRWWR